MRRRGVALVAVAALIAGCSLQPVYERPAAPVAATYPTGEAYKSPTGGSGSTTLPAVDIGWRDFLTDPRLQRLVEIALANNRDLRVAALNVAQAQAQYRIQRAALFPQVGGFANSSSCRARRQVFRPRGSATVTHDYSVGLSAAWEIDFFGRLQSLSDQALQQYFATAQARKAVEILLVSEIADQYLTLLAYDELARGDATTRSRPRRRRTSSRCCNSRPAPEPSFRCVSRKPSSSRRRPTMRRSFAGARKPRTRWCCCSASRFPRISRRRFR